MWNRALFLVAHRSGTLALKNPPSALCVFHLPPGSAANSHSAADRPLPDLDELIPITDSSRSDSSCTCRSERVQLQLWKTVWHLLVCVAENDYRFALFDLAEDVHEL